MERVQFQQEQMLAELKDLVQKGLFTQKEIKQIMQKRTAFETALVRRIPKKSDFLRYAAYEMGLEALRRKRVERLKQGPQPPSVSDFALVRRQFHIFERALKKFKNDVGLWTQYMQVAKREGARTLVGRISARALQLHPNVPALYILAAAHELEHLSPSSARALLQRGIRLNADSVEMWREYVKMELGFVESMRRRWGVLGIDVDEGTDKGKGKAREADVAGNERTAAKMGNEEIDKMEVDAKDEGEDGEAARREIMNGAIVRSVISSAVKALPQISLFTSLHELLATYPCPQSLRNALLDHLFALLHSTLPLDPSAIKLSATRALTPGLDGEALIDALKSANEQLAHAVRNRGEGHAGEALAVLYAEFVQEWCSKDIDESLKGYLITSLQLLAQRASPAPSPALLAATIRLLTSHHQALRMHLPPSGSTSEKVLRFARKHTAKDRTIARASAAVWLARLDAEWVLGSADGAQSAWDEARGAVEGEGLEHVWMWGVDRAEASDVRAEERVRILEVRALLGFTFMLGSRVRLAGLTRSREFAAKSTSTVPPAVVAVVDARAARVRHIAQGYLPSARVWQGVFAQEAAAAEQMAARSAPDALDRVLATVYEQWRQKDGVGATVEWARWLLAHGRALEAKDVVLRAGSWLASGDAREVERRWKMVVDAPESEE
ncbi:hypothetical protein POSPLADRAFT_1131679 [Postia placenta MAD-698-R-SB12]|uniref:U3 small nucleolar RNA-associated protein 6 N-terminal domain-containing protein n=1 Tax=Postia placenta MAD-698-R-SB12 TaxID=670580 RepID=A0A1X6ND49_9APHY|nr:hypothetical protein POSPLADRAFT_1131679 [Postia placenta MAD-698-R-SB12]OSX66575.1 hypothetical protein POSPLADRAFT_1131679 [Postia placenta MAD-698-R-SB12]